MSFRDNLSSGLKYLRRRLTPGNVNGAQRSNDVITSATGTGPRSGAAVQPGPTPGDVVRRPVVPAVRNPNVAKTASNCKDSTVSKKNGSAVNVSDAKLTGRPGEAKTVSPFTEVGLSYRVTSAKSLTSSTSNIQRDSGSEERRVRASCSDLTESRDDKPRRDEGNGTGFGNNGSLPDTRMRNLFGLDDVKYKIILVIDDPQTEWDKYFRGRKVFGDWNLRTEQAEFSQINVCSSSTEGTVVSISGSTVTKDNQIYRSFKPDFLLVRQHVQNGVHNYNNVLLALQYGGLKSVNSLQALFNFIDKPWVCNSLPAFPVVVKIGIAHSGLGKIKVDNRYDFMDVVSVVAVTDCYVTVEPFIDSTCDVYVQKIGANYRAFKRQGMSGHWKANIGSTTIEPVAMNERYRLWVDECSQLFGGLDMLAVKALMDKNGREHIIQVIDSSMMLFGDRAQIDEDLMNIAGLVINRLQVYCRPHVSALFNICSTVTPSTCKRPPFQPTSCNATSQLPSPRTSNNVGQGQLQPARSSVSARLIPRSSDVSLNITQSQSPYSAACARLSSSCDTNLAQETTIVSPLSSSSDLGLPLLQTAISAPICLSRKPNSRYVDQAQLQQKISSHVSSSCELDPLDSSQSLVCTAPFPFITALQSSGPLYSSCDIGLAQLQPTSSVSLFSSCDIGLGREGAQPTRDSSSHALASCPNPVTSQTLQSSVKYADCSKSRRDARVNIGTSEPDQSTQHGCVSVSVCDQPRVIPPPIPRRPLPNGTISSTSPSADYSRNGVKVIAQPLPSIVSSTACHTFQSLPAIPAPHNNTCFVDKMEDPGQCYCTLCSISTVHDVSPLRTIQMTPRKILEEYEDIVRVSHCHAGSQFSSALPVKTNFTCDGVDETEENDEEDTMLNLRKSFAAIFGHI